MNLSKSRYTQGITCSKKLWLSCYKEEEAYLSLKDLDKEEQNKLRHNMLKYCELDTYAMVKIYEKLKEVIKQ